MWFLLFRFFDELLQKKVIFENVGKSTTTGSEMSLLLLLFFILN